MNSIKNKMINIFCVLFIAVLISASVNAQEVIDRVVAIVNDDRSDWNRAI